MKTLNTNPLAKLKPKIREILFICQLNNRDIEDTRMYVAQCVTQNNITVDLVAVLPNYDAFVRSGRHTIKVRP